MTLTHDDDLSAFNTLGLATRAQTLLRFNDPEQLPQVHDHAQAQPRRLVLGGGSNVVLPASVPGLVIKVETQGIKLLDESAGQRIIEVQAGEVWHDFVSHSLGQGWPGLENLALIPGTVGAAPVQNIGAYGVELDQRFHSLIAWDFESGRLLEMGPQDCGFAYRDSVFKRSPPGRWLIVAVRFKLPVSWRPVLDYPDLQRHPLLQGPGVQARQVFDAVCEVRRSKLPDPAVLANAGSFFKNPLVQATQVVHLQQAWPDLVAYAQPDGHYKLAAGWLIDRAGWKGKRLGPVGMHERQALVLVNHGGATAADVQTLAEQVKESVWQRFGVRLEQEPVQIGT